MLHYYVLLHLTYVAHFGGKQISFLTRHIEAKYNEHAELFRKGGSVERGAERAVSTRNRKCVQTLLRINITRAGFE